MVKGKDHLTNDDRIKNLEKQVKGLAVDLDSLRSLVCKYVNSLPFQGFGKEMAINSLEEEASKQERVFYIGLESNPINSSIIENLSPYSKNYLEMRKKEIEEKEEKSKVEILRVIELQDKEG